ncbi:PepSY domain-containing protein [Aeromonas tecta]|uniref:PepSY domain-containing protein n=1 Tax=Aeromonas tecta TaxID=324617 RepID=UPI00068194D0|nr:PepSY domain-containing protein [Aeromonas tecta]
MNMIPRSILLILCLFSTLGWAAQTRLEMPALIKLLLAQGYHDIREVELEGDTFEVSTLNAKEQKVRLIVDAYTGEITQQKEAN